MLRTGLLLSLATSALADNLALESQAYLAHTACHTEYEHVTVVKQGQLDGREGKLLMTLFLCSAHLLQALHNC